AAESPICRATQPPNRHHNHAESADDIAPIQNEIAIRTMRERCSRKYVARARTRACVAETSAGLAVIATARRSRPVLFVSAAYSAHSAQAARCKSSYVASAAATSS